MTAIKGKESAGESKTLQLSKEQKERGNLDMDKPVLLTTAGNGVHPHFREISFYILLGVWRKKNNSKTKEVLTITPSIKNKRKTLWLYIY